MCEIGDEELNDIIPRENKELKNEFQDIGYYRDEKGYMRYGVIPKNYSNDGVKATLEYPSDGRNVNSNPNYR